MGSNCSSSSASAPTRRDGAYPRDHGGEALSHEEEEIGGLERHVALLSESIAASREDVRVTVVTAHQSPARASFEERRGISVHRATTLGRFQRTPISLELPALLRRTRADILHYHSSHPWPSSSRQSGAAFRLR